jgi:hypothetical protein
MKNVLHPVVFSGLCFAGIIASGMTAAEELRMVCDDGGYTDIANSVTRVGDRTLKVTVEDFDAKLGRFNMRVSSALGVAEDTARSAAQFTSMVFCFHFDSASADTGFAKLQGDAWLIEAGCRDGNLRMVDRC